jgi:hypothetical protein
MRDEAAVAVDDVSIARRADLDRADDVPNEFEIDLGYGDAGGAADMRRRDGHVGLGFLAEINRAEPDLVGDRLGKPWIVRVVAAAPDHVHREPGHFELFLSLAVDLDQLGDRRHLPQ